MKFLGPCVQAGCVLLIIIFIICWPPVYLWEFVTLSTLTCTLPCVCGVELAVTVVSSALRSHLPFQILVNLVAS